MFRAVTIQGASVHTASNWALGSTAGYLGLLVATLDKILPHLAEGWHRPMFGFALASMVVGGWDSDRCGVNTVRHNGGKPRLPLCFPANDKSQRIRRYAGPWRHGCKLCQTKKRGRRERICRIPAMAFRELAEFDLKRTDESHPVHAQNGSCAPTDEFCVYDSAIHPSGLCCLWPFVRIR